MKQKSFTIAITGASGVQYGIRLLQCLLQAKQRVYLLISDPAKVVIATETQFKLPSDSSAIAQFFCREFSVNESLLSVFNKNQWMAPVASGSNPTDAMIICPCSTGTLSAISVGSSRSLIERAADVMLKEGRKLILVPREAPYSSIHLENMLKLSKLGVSIIPASPAFYHRPETITQLIDTIVARILDHLAIPHNLVQRWGE